MSEVIVAKAGGTSNATAEAVLKSLDWAESSNIFVVSAPGGLDGDGPESQKITDLLISARDSYESDGDIPKELIEVVTARYQDIISGLGALSLPRGWVSSISGRLHEAVRHSEASASTFGEQLQAEIYQAAGYELLDPGRAPTNLGSDRQAWREWLSQIVNLNQRYVLPGNTTKVNGHVAAFDRGGSDISGGLAAYGIRADRNLNLTDGSAKSADPKLVPEQFLRHIIHMLYEEGRELGRNGTGLLHPAAMVPLMQGDIPTEIRSTFDESAPFTILDNDSRRAEAREGRIIALSLMEDVAIVQVHEPGMAEAVGRLADLDRSLAANGVRIIDSKGDGVDSQKYFVEAKFTEMALSALRNAISSGKVSVKEGVDLITMVGYGLHARLIDNLVKLIFSAEFDPKYWQAQGHDLSIGRHSIRISADSNQSHNLLTELHRHFVTDHPSPLR